MTHGNQAGIQTEQTQQLMQDWGQDTDEVTALNGNTNEPNTQEDDQVKLIINQTMPGKQTGGQEGEQGMTHQENLQ